MSQLDRRRIELVQCAGISITTFLADDRATILVSASDLIDNLSMDEDTSGVDIFEYVAYDSIGRQQTHQCIKHSDINEFLWMNGCKETSTENLMDFRRFFSHEVMNFWQRFSHSAASLSVRDAVNLIDIKTHEYHDTLGLPPGRIFQLAFESLGYDRVPNKDNLTTEELSFIAFAELLYASVAASEQANGCTAGESMRSADMRLVEPLKAIGRVTRGISGI